MTTSRSRLAVGCAALALLAAGCAHGPRPGVISTSRLGLAKPAGTVARGVVQLEAGYSQAHRDERTQHSIGETLLRVGMGPRTEARIGISSYQRTVTPAATVEGLADASVAVKHRLRDAAGWLPALAATAGTTIPTGADRVSASAMQPEGSLAAEWTLPYNLRALAFAAHREGIAGGDRFGQNTLAAAGRVIVAPGMIGHLELARVSSTREGATDVNQIRAGAAVRLTPSLQLDLWGGRTSSSGRHERLFGLGFARRW